VAAPLALALSGQTVKGKISDVQFALTYSPTPNAADFNLVLTHEKFKGAAQADVHLESFTSTGSGSVKDGKVRSFEARVDKIAGKADFQIKLTGTSNTDVVKIPPMMKLPIEVSVPFPIAGIPFTYTMGTTIEMHVAISIAGDSLMGEAHVSFGGDAGFNFDGGKLQLSGNRTQDSPDTLTSLRGGSAGPVGIVLTTELPKVALGFKVAQTGASVFLSSGMSMSMFIAGGSPIPCLNQQLAYVLAAGVEAQFLGKGIPIARKAIVDKRWDRFAPNHPACRGS
jgi:hypothetical protein